MKTHVYTLELKDSEEIIAQYKAHHQNPWPELVRGMKDFGVIKDDIYLLGNRIVMVLQCKDNMDLEDVGKRPLSEREKEWETLMNSFQQQLPWAGEGQWWMEMEQVFDFEKQAAELK